MVVVLVVTGVGADAVVAMVVGGAGGRWCVVILEYPNLHDAVLRKTGVFVLHKV